MKITIFPAFHFQPQPSPTKTIKVIKLTAFLPFIFLFQVNAKGFSQKITLNLHKAPAAKVFMEVEKQSGYGFIYAIEQLTRMKPIDLVVVNADLKSVLNKVFEGQLLTYNISGNTVSIMERELHPAVIYPDEKSPPFAVDGRVVDEDGSPMQGVNVLLKNSNSGEATDKDGKFSFNVPDGGGRLVFSYVGFENYEVKVSGPADLNIILKRIEAKADEIVVVGYGNQKKRDVIGSISTIRPEVFKTPNGSSNFSSLLQGQAAGVSVQSTSGRLGADVDIKIRGLSSISAAVSPLWIIDGVPIITDIAIGNNNSAALSPMSLINQADIESIQILKDAAATAIYGSRGSNGVIIITTKSGVTGHNSINIDYTAGLSSLPAQRVHFINTNQWFRIKDEAKEAYGLGPYDLMSDFYAKKVYATEFLTRDQAQTINTDWRKATMQTGNFQNINLSTMGGDKNVRYYVSGNYRKDQSVIRNEDLQRYGVRANIDIKPAKSLDMGAKINLSLSKGNRGKNNNQGVEDGNKNGTSGGFAFVNSATAPFDPVYSLANPGLYYNPYSGNPAASSDRANLVEDLLVYRVLANAYGEYAIPHVKGLSARTELSIDFIQANRNYWVSDAIRKEGSFGQDNSSTSRTINYNFFFKYNNNFGDHSFGLIAGTESQRGSTWYRSMEGKNLVGNYQQLGTPSLIVTQFSGLAGEGYLKSYFARANYKFKDKYLAGISFRRDGSSVFTPNYRWGNFTALSAGWIISEESFMGEFGRNNFLKIRGSYGQTGNANIPGNLDVTNYHGSLPYGSADVFATNGTMVNSIGVSNLRWEKTDNLDLGLDFGFLNRKIEGSIAYYNKYVSGLLLASALPPSAGIGSLFVGGTIWGNIGDLVNRGIELSVTSSNIISKNFRWSTTLNFATNHNEIKKLTPAVDKTGTGMAAVPFISKTGFGVNDYYIADFAGVDPQTGLGQIYSVDTAYYSKTGETRRLKDSHGKDSLMVDTRPNMDGNIFHLKGKNPTPTFYGGISNRFTFKAFDFSFLVTFSGGNYILDGFLRDLSSPNAAGEIVAGFDQNYWKKPGDKSKYQRLDWLGNIKMEDGSFVAVGDPRAFTTQFLFKGDYVKLKSVTLGYTLLSSAQRKFFNTLRVYASVENIYTLTKYPGWDPEGQGLVNQWNLPQLFSASAGVSVKF